MQLLPLYQKAENIPITSLSDLKNIDIMLGSNHLNSKERIVNLETRRDGLKVLAMIHW